MFSFRIRAFLFAILATGATACEPIHEPDPSDADLLGDARSSALARRGHLHVALGAGREDPAVIADARSLVADAVNQVAALDFEAGHHIAVTYLGKGRTGAMAPDDGSPGGPTEDEGEALEGMDAFNLATGNEFRIVLSGGLLEAVGRRDGALGLDLGAPGDAGEPRAPSGYLEDSPLDPGAGLAYAWSNGDDDRFRVYNFNAAVTNGTDRRLVQLGGGCSGTLVGPRHVVTAGHCLWSRTNQSWSNNFWVRAGANGTNFVTRVFLDATNIPSGQVVWYFTPSQYRATSGSTWGFDYGVLTIPARLGDTVGWMGRVSYNSVSLQSSNIFRRGYPSCSATWNGALRTDIPIPCSPNHLYANTANCTVGEFESLDSDNWSRVVHHSCDASGGDSGSALYVIHNGAPCVTAVHFASRCEKGPGDVACTGAWVNRPLAALRLTPEYRDWIGYFRNKYP